MTIEKKWRFGVAGNIVRSHLDKQGIVRYGSKAFTGGTKVYLFGFVNALTYGEMLVLGLNRYHRYSIEAIPLNLIENFRMQRIFKPKILEILNYEECVEGIQYWGRTAADRKDAEHFIKICNIISPIKGKLDELNIELDEQKIIFEMIWSYECLNKMKTIISQQNILNKEELLSIAKEIKNKTT